MPPDLICIIAEEAGSGPGGVATFWWTFAAQVANFLLLVLVLRALLYKRVLKAMDQREKKIAAHFEAAEQKEREAGEQAAALERERQDLAGRREAMLREAREETARLREDLTGQARRDVDRQAARWREDLERGQEAFLDQVRTRAGRQVCEAARQALETLADEDLEGRMVRVLARRLRDLPPEQVREFAEAVQASGKPLVVATSMDLAAAHRGPVAEAVRQILGDVPLEFQTAADLGCGIELRAAGREISWTVAGYVQGIRDELARVIDEKLRGGTEPTDG